MTVTDSEQHTTIPGKNPSASGFTLVEILIVVVIVGILSTVTVFAVRGITDRGQEALIALTEIPQVCSSKFPTCEVGSS